jgi:hypothetical protein
MYSEQNESPDYLSYLMRLWQAPGNEEHLWRASLEVPLTQKVLHFDSLPRLFDFLLAQIGQPGQGARVDGDTPLPGSS